MRQMTSRSGKSGASGGLARSSLISKRSAIHPGEHLREQLEALEMSAAKFATQLDVPTNRITQILRGERSITGDTALRLAHYFGTSPEFWLNLQSIYEIRLAQQQAGKTIAALPTLKEHVAA